MDETNEPNTNYYKRTNLTGFKHIIYKIGNKLRFYKISTLYFSGDKQEGKST